MAVLDLFGEAHAVIQPDVELLFRADTDGDTPETGGFQVGQDGLHEPCAKAAAPVFLFDPEGTQVGGGFSVREIPVKGDIPEDIQSLRPRW